MDRLNLVDEEEIEPAEAVGLLIVSKIANSLFWINLLPAIVASIVVFIGLLGVIIHTDYSGIAGIMLLVLGIYCEYIYFRQRSSEEYALKRIGWIYSLITNLIFICPYVGMLFAKEAGLGWVAILGIYPLSFFIASVYALLKIARYPVNID